MTNTVDIFEVSLRDGLQNEAVVVPTADKLRHLAALVAAGVRDVEVTSFVRASRIPALADAEEVLAALPATLRAAEAAAGLPSGSVRTWSLVPNQVGMDRALSSGVRAICTFLSASETHNLRNVNRTVGESLQGLKRVVATAVDEGVAVRAYISTVFGCPYEGAVDPQRVVDLSLELLGYGAQRVVLGDTTGVGLPHQVQDVLARLLAAGVPIERIGLHAHDTRGTALTNVYAAWQVGVRAFDGAVAGIGGCPYAPGAAGNVATEDLVHLFEGMGVRTGVDLDLLAEAGWGMEAILGRPLPGRVHQALRPTSCEPARRTA